MIVKSLKVWSSPEWELEKEDKEGNKLFCKKRKLLIHDENVDIKFISMNETKKNERG